MNEANNIERQEKIRAYLLGQLNSEEKRRFEEELEKDTLLREEFAIERSLFETMNEDDWSLADIPLEKDRVKALNVQLRSDKSKQLSNLIKEVGKEYTSSGEIRSAKRKWYYIVAACGVALLLITSFFMMQPSGLQQYYAAYKDWDELPSFVEKDKTVNELAKGEQLYNAKQLEDAVAYFTGLLKTAKGEDVPFALMYLGASYFELGDYNKALETFDQLTLNDTIESSRGYWYQLLIYLKLEDLDNAKRIIELITANSKNYKYNQAQELNKKLNH